MPMPDQAKTVHARAIGAIVALLISLQAFAADITKQIDIGDALQLPVLADQFENKHAFNTDTKWFVFSHDMDSGYMVKEAFEGLNSEKLSASGIQYYSDISTMPDLYYRYVMLPKFQELDYPMILGRATVDLKHIPRITGKAMMLRLNKGKVVELLSADRPQVIQQYLFSPES